MTEAEEAFADLSEPTSHSILSFDAPYLPFYAGTAYVWLAQPLRAQECTARAIELCDADPIAWPVARVLTRIDQASALAQSDEPEAACRLGADALAIALSERPVEPIRRRAHELWGSLQRFGNLPSVRDFEEQLRASCDVFTLGPGAISP